MPTACSTSSAEFPGGVTCFVEDGILCYEYNLFEIQRTKIRTQTQLPSGKVKIEIETNHRDFVPRGPERDDHGERRTHRRRTEPAPAP